MSSFVNSNQSSATRYDFIEHVRHVCRESGYGVSIKRSDGGRRVLLAWNLGRDYMKRSAGNAEGKTRKTGTRLQGCHWEAFGKKSRDGSWKVKMRKSQHTIMNLQIIWLGTQDAEECLEKKRSAYRNLYQPDYPHFGHKRFCVLNFPNHWLRQKTSTTLSRNLV